MADAGIALAPTLRAFQQMASERDLSQPAGRFLKEGTNGHPALIRAANGAGVRILAGTDSPPFGNVAAEVRARRSGASGPSRRRRGVVGGANVPWRAADRGGAPADIVAFDVDPLLEPDALRYPSRIILRGRVLR